MSIQEQTVDIPLTRLDQKASPAAGPIGRLQRLVDAYADKYNTPGGDFLRTKKRPGFVAVSQAIADPYDGGPAGGAPPGVPSPTLLGKLGEQLFAIGSDAIPYVFNPGADAWERYDRETVLTAAPSLAPIYTRATVIHHPDSAVTSDGTTCYVWIEGADAKIMLIGPGGTVALQPAVVASGAGGRVKVVSDGGRFWVFSDAGSATVTVTAYNTDGAVAATATAGTLQASLTETWDVTYQDDAIGVALVQRGKYDGSTGTGGSLVLLSYNSGSISVSSQYNASIYWGTDGGTSTDLGSGIVRNDNVDGYLYLATFYSTDLTANYTVRVQKLSATAAISHTFVPINAAAFPAKGIVNVTGHVQAAGTVHVLVSRLKYRGGSPPQGGDQTLTVTDHGYSTPTVDGLGFATIRSVGLASRVFYVQGIPVAAVYYASYPPQAYSYIDPVTGFPVQRQNIGQPTYFLVRADNLAVVGRLMHGFAAADWLWGQDPTEPGASTWDGTSPPTAFGFGLTSGRLVSSTAVEVALGQQGQQQFGVTHSGAIGYPIAVTAVGITDLQLGTPGVALELPGETLIPGPLARSFDGQSFGASGIELDPEMWGITFTRHSTGGSFTEGMVFEYVAVFERVDSQGRRIYSGSSIPVSYPVPSGATDDSVDVVIPSLRTTTHDDIIVSIYRTAWSSSTSTQGTIHYKVSNDLDPLLNDPTADTITFHDATAPDATGTVLYGGSGANTTGGDFAEVDHDPAPPFSRGCTFQARVFLIGYDGQVWFSLPQNPGSPAVFNEGLFELGMPTNEAVTALVPMDGRLIVFCARSIWTVDGGAFLDATGQGNTPSPQQLPIPNGCTGMAAICPGGIIYAASTGGFYLLGRDLTSTYVGGQVEDETAGVAITAVVTDDAQRVYFQAGATTLLVYDIVFQGWYVWTTPTAPTALTTWKGAVVYADATGPDVLVADAGASADELSSGLHAIITTVELAPFGFADVQMFWELAFQCQRNPAGSITVTLTYDLDDANTETWPAFAAADADGTGRVSVQLAQPECSYVQVTLTDSFPLGPGAGWQLEKLVASLGVLPGMARRGIQQRIAP